MKKLIVYLIAYFLPSLGCLLTAVLLVPQGAWHDILLLVSGVLLCGVGFELSLVNSELNKRIQAHDVNKER